MRSSSLFGSSDSSLRDFDEPSWLADAIRAAESSQNLNLGGKLSSAPGRLEESELVSSLSSESSVSFSNAVLRENSNLNGADEKEAKRKFNDCVRAQKECEKNGDVDGQIRALRGALTVRPENEKVRRKLEKLQKLQADVMARKLEEMEAAAQAKAEASARAASELLASAPKAETIVVDGFKHRPGAKSYQLAKGYKLPAEVFEKLFKYQREAIRWMWDLHRREAGGVLADEMGLGKTVQVAAFLRGLFASKLVETVLIVMPKSVVENWRKEVAHWTKRPVLVYEGTKLQRERVLEQVAAAGGVVLTTYGMVRTNADKLAGLESPRSGEFEQWDYVILDEGHKIKNSSTEGAKSIKQIESPHKLVLTGTPVLNQLMELWALYDYVQPGLLGDLKTFRTMFDDPIVRASHKNAKADLKEHGQLMLQKLKELIKPHFLRRVKEEVFSQRPAAAAASTEVVPNSDQLLLEKHRIKVRKNDLICWVSMSAVQLELYDKFLTLPEVKEIFNSSKSPLAAITVLKKICLHPRLLHSKMKTLRETAAASDGSEPLEGEWGKVNRVVFF
jgi:SNF2 family DNA or RNA helicase